MTTSNETYTYPQSVDEVVAPTEAAPWLSTYRPTNPWPGLFGFATDLGVFEFWDGVSWKVPVWNTNPLVVGNLQVNGTLGVTGAATFASSVSITGNLTNTGPTSVATFRRIRQNGAWRMDHLPDFNDMPLGMAFAIQAAVDPNNAPVQQPYNLNQITTPSDVGYGYTDETRSNFSTMRVWFSSHTLGSAGAPVATSWGGARIHDMSQTVTRNSPRESIMDKPSTKPEIIDGWRQITLNNTFGGTEPLNGRGRGRVQVRYAKLVLSGVAPNTGYNFTLGEGYEFEWQALGRGSARRGLGFNANLLSQESVNPPEGFIAYTGGKPRHSPGWHVMFGQGNDATQALDQHQGRFVAHGASWADRTPTSLHGIDIRDVTYFGSAIRWQGGDLAGGALGANDTGRLRIGPGFVRGDSAGLVVEATGYQGAPTGTQFSGGSLAGNVNVPFGYNIILFDDEHGGVYYGQPDDTGKNITLITTLTPPVWDGRAGAPPNPVDLWLRDTMAGVWRFAVTSTATTTTTPTNLSVLTENFFSDNGPYFLEYLTGECAGERRAIEGYNATTGELTTAAFSTVPTTILQLVTNQNFNLPFPLTPDTILNGWEWTVFGGTGTVTAAAGVCSLVGGSLGARLDQALTTTGSIIYEIRITHVESFRVLIGTARGDDDIANIEVGYGGEGEFIESPVVFAATGPTTWIGFLSEDPTSVVRLDLVICAQEGGAFTNGVQARILAPPVQITQTWTPRHHLTLGGDEIHLDGPVILDDPASFAANDTTATVLTSLGPAGAGLTVAKWLVITDDNGDKFVIPAWSYTPP